MGIPKEELHRLIDALPEQNTTRAKRYLERLLKEQLPISPASPRPGNKPYYIKPNCPKCGALLVLADILENPDVEEEEIWHDEFMCPSCRDGTYMDWPDSEWQEIEEVIQTRTKGQVQDWNDVKRELGLCSD
ncbi:MAG: hypothetical protein STSR0004_19280 [Peptococcaceae bacterium]